MNRLHLRRLMAPALTLVALAALAAPVAAARPEMYSWSNHRDGPALDCPGFVAYGEWDLDHTLTLFGAEDGTPDSDIETVAFEGSFYNPATGASVPDRGTKRFLDELAPDGSYLSTVMTYQRTDAFVHEAGRIVLGPQDEYGDQPERSSVGHFGFTDANIAALCAELSE